MKNFKKLIGARIREKRTAMGKTQEELASLVDVDQSRIARWERGDSFPEPAFRERLKEVMGVDEAFFDLDPALVSLDGNKSLMGLIDIFGKLNEGQRGLLEGFATGLIATGDSELVKPPKRF